MSWLPRKSHLGLTGGSYKNMGRKCVLMLRDSLKFLSMLWQEVKGIPFFELDLDPLRVSLDKVLPYCLLIPPLLVHVHNILNAQHKLFQYINFRNGPDSGIKKLTVISWRRSGYSLLDHLSYSLCQTGGRYVGFWVLLSDNINRKMPLSNKHWGGGSLA